MPPTSAPMPAPLPAPNLTRLVIVHLALGILPDDRGIFEVELSPLLRLLHRVQRLVGGRFVEERHDQEADGGYALLL